MTKLELLKQDAEKLRMNLMAFALAIDAAMEEPTLVPDVATDDEKILAGGAETASYYMEVEEVTGVPGETVDVRIFGGSAVRADGYWITLGTNRSVTVENVVLGKFFDEHAEKDGVRHDDFRWASGIERQGRFGFVRISYAMIKFTLQSGVEGFETSVRIPPATVLATITYRLLPDSKGSYIAQYGGGTIDNRATVFTTDVQGAPLRPVVQNGHIRI